MSGAYKSNCRSMNSEGSLTCYCDKRPHSHLQGLVSVIKLNLQPSASVKQELCQ